MVCVVSGRFNGLVPWLAACFHPTQSAGSPIAWRWASGQQTRPSQFEHPLSPVQNTHLAISKLLDLPWKGQRPEHLDGIFQRRHQLYRIRHTRHLTITHDNLSPDVTCRFVYTLSNTYLPLPSLSHPYLHSGLRIPLHKIEICETIRSTISLMTSLIFTYLSLHSIHRRRARYPLLISKPTFICSSSRNHTSLPELCLLTRLLMRPLKP